VIQLLRALDAPVVDVDAGIEQKLTEAVGEWREVLGRQTPQARQIISKLFVEKVSFAPEGRADGRKGFPFSAIGTVEKLISGAVPRVSQAVESPRGLVDLYQVEIGGEIRKAA
jgi:hypothetical protein